MRCWDGVSLPRGLVGGRGKGGIKKGKTVKRNPTTFIIIAILEMMFNLPLPSFRSSFLMVSVCLCRSIASLPPFPRDSGGMGVRLLSVYYHQYRFLSEMYIHIIFF